MKDLKNLHDNYYDIDSLPKYFDLYRIAKEDPEHFWSKIAEDNFQWHQKWDKVYEFDQKKIKLEWFANAKLNITENCLDRHLESKAEQTAILFEPNHPNDPVERISYKNLYHRVCKMANVLKNKGVNKGDRVVLYMPMIPELAVSVLACARIGAVHSVVFAGFSAKALSSRINDCDSKIVLTADISRRGSKHIALKEIVDEALADCPQVSTVLLARCGKAEVQIKEGRDYWLQGELEKVDDHCPAEIMDAEDPLFILYTSGSTGKPKGMLHTCAGYMVYTAYTFKNVFQYKPGDIYWCTADIGWITGHSYIVYGPLLNGATTLMFEGVPSYPDYGRFWKIVDKHQVNQFYTAPTAIRALAQQGLQYVEPYDLSSLKVLGSVGEPINEEAWHWYNHNIGKGKAPIADTYWQTETGGIMITPIPFVTPTKPTYATLPMPGILPVLMNEEGKTIDEKPAEGRLCIQRPWPSMARTIYGNHQRYIDTYFSAYPGYYFTGDGCKRDEVGYHRITGRVDDVIIVSGHNLGTAPIEDAINEHDLISESAIVGYPHPVKGSSIYAYVCAEKSLSQEEQENIKNEINQLIRTQVGPIAKAEKIQFVKGLPKTRSGKIMRRILRKIAEGELDSFGDISTLLNPEVVQDIKANRIP